MSKTVIKRPWLLFIIVLGLVPSYGQGTLPKNLAFGEFKIGFQIFHEYDRRRSFFPKRDYYNARTNFETDRPMQVAVWYPAADNAKGTPMKYRDYIGLSSSEINFAKNTKNYRSKRIDETLASFPEEARERVADLFNSDIDVSIGATRHPGEFPLVLYSPPQDTAFYDNSVLCKYLASKGYIVIATTTKGEYSRLQGLSARSIEVQAEDLGYLLEFGTRFTKSDKIGTFGFSRGGLANLLFALKNKNIDATVSIDGSVFSQGWLDDMKDNSYFVPEEFNSNLLMLTKNLADPKKNPATFYEQVKYADKYLVRFDHESHGYFSAYDLMTDLLVNKTLSDLQKTGYINFHAEMIAYVGEFFDAYLKNKGIFKEHKDKKFNHSFSFGKFQARSIEPSNIGFWISEKGIDYVTRIVDEIEKGEPAYVSKLRWRDLNEIAGIKITEKSYEDAVKILLLSDRALPLWYQTNYQLGQCYQNLGNAKKAIEHFQRALRDNPRHSESIDALKKMNLLYDYHDTRIKAGEVTKYLGRYEVDANNYKEIILKENELFFVSSSASSSVKIWPYDEKLFISEENDPRSNIQIVFELNDSGQVVSLKTRGMNSGRVGEPFLKK